MSDNNNRYLFRGKAKGDQGTWVEGYYHFDQSTGAHYICKKENLARVEVDPETVGQVQRYLPDGTPLFEGDIVLVR